MDHCLAQVFGICPPLRLTNRDRVGCTVIFHNQWMVHRNICRPLFKVGYRIAAPRGESLPAFDSLFK